MQTYPFISKKAQITRRASRSSQRNNISITNSNNKRNCSQIRLYSCHRPCKPQTRHNSNLRALPQASHSSTHSRTNRPSSRNPPLRPPLVAEASAVASGATNSLSQANTHSLPTRMGRLARARAGLRWSVHRSWVLVKKMMARVMTMEVAGILGMIRGAIRVRSAGNASIGRVASKYTLTHTRARSVSVLYVYVFRGCMAVAVMPLFAIFVSPHRLQITEMTSALQRSCAHCQDAAAPSTSRATCVAITAIM